jgi:beta-lactam-binding protein with PASTA domain
LKSFFRLVFLALVLLVVALVSALTAMRFAIHGQEVRVPDLVGKTPAEARRIADASGFQMDVERQYYSPSVAEGRILSQLPLPGTEVRRGWQIRVAQSLGPQRVEIPNVLGETERAAEINIRRRGLDVGAVAQIEMLVAPMSGAQAPGATPDQVVAQSPPPSASGVSTPKISLLVTEPAPPQAFVMPSFIGQSLGGAKLALQDGGMRLGSVTETEQTVNATTVPSGPAPAVFPSLPQPLSSRPSLPQLSLPQPSPASVIVSQSPPAGGKVVAGTAVNFEVR